MDGHMGSYRAIEIRLRRRTALGVVVTAGVDGSGIIVNRGSALRFGGFYLEPRSLEAASILDSDSDGEDRRGVGNVDGEGLGLTTIYERTMV